MARIWKLFFFPPPYFPLRTPAPPPPSIESKGPRINYEIIRSNGRAKVVQIFSLGISNVAFEYLAFPSSPPTSIGIKIFFSLKLFFRFIRQHLRFDYMYTIKLRIV